MTFLTDEKYEKLNKRVDEILAGENQKLWIIQLLIDTFYRGLIEGVDAVTQKRKKRFWGLI